MDQTWCKSHKVIKIIQVRDPESFDKGGCKGGGETWLDLEYILNVEPRGFTDGV